MISWLAWEGMAKEAARAQKGGTKTMPTDTRCGVFFFFFGLVRWKCLDSCGIYNVTLSLIPQPVAIINLLFNNQVAN
jgi:hypothetical protein